VEGAEADELPALLAYPDVVLDDLQQVQPRLDLLDGVVRPGD